MIKTERQAPKEDLLTPAKVLIEDFPELEIKNCNLD
jgi:hypothetical protein